MELQALIDLLIEATAATVLAVVLAISLWTNKIIATALRDSWKARLEDAQRYIKSAEKSTEKLAELMGRGQGG
jgi:hypothetical protein